MKLVGKCILSIGVVVGLVGCTSPELAQTPLGPTEQNWAKYLENAYPEWKPPKTMPPVAEPVGALPEVNSANNVDEVPVFTANTPADDMDIKLPEAGFKAAPVDVEVIDKVQSEKFDIYTVNKNDSLWVISKKVYKTGNKWRLIYDANRDVLATPTSVKPGMELKIPLQ
jgi:LysM repeat protein